MVLQRVILCAAVLFSASAAATPNPVAEAPMRARPTVEPTSISSARLHLEPTSQAAWSRLDIETVERVRGTLGQDRFSLRNPLGQEIASVDVSHLSDRRSFRLESWDGTAVTLSLDFIRGWLRLEDHGSGASVELAVDRSRRRWQSSRGSQRELLAMHRDEIVVLTELDAHFYRQRRQVTGEAASCGDSARTAVPEQPFWKIPPGGIVCGHYNECRSNAIDSTRSFCCSEAAIQLTSCCANSICYGCCERLDCDATCAIGDLLCVCGQSGSRCRWEDDF